MGPPKPERAHHMHLIPRTRPRAKRMKGRFDKEAYDYHMGPLSKILINFFPPIHVFLSHGIRVPPPSVDGRASFLFIKYCIILRGSSLRRPDDDNRPGDLLQ